MAHRLDDNATAVSDGTAGRRSRRWILWGSELSPFALKVESILRFGQLEYRWLPATGRGFEALRGEIRRSALVRRRLPLTWPVMTGLDEFPQVPFLFGELGENLYDSSAIGHWLVQSEPSSDRLGSAFLGGNDPLARFVVHLLDEAFDEIGLYLVHHNRWVVSARDNDAGRRLGIEYRPLLGPFARALARSFPARQVRRLPYLFSVADAGDPAWQDLPPRLRPPSRPEFPPTHALLDRIFLDLLGSIEPILSHRAFLLGNYFTLADASLYGQLGMNRKDPSAWALLQRQAPATAAWIERIANGNFAGHDGRQSPLADSRLAPLVAWASRSFVPLMQQNYAAWQRHRDAGETVFNEPAFDSGRALFDGILIGVPFRSVAKTFQVRVWQDLLEHWRRLPRDQASPLFPEGLSNVD